MRVLKSVKHSFNAYNLEGYSLHFPLATNAETVLLPCQSQVLWCRCAARAQLRGTEEEEEEEELGIAQAVVAG